MLFVFAAAFTTHFTAVEAGKRNALNLSHAPMQEKVLAVRITDDQGKPVRNVTVFLQREGVNEMTKQITDETGIVSFLCRQYGVYTVRTQHPDFETAEDKIAISEEDKQDSYFMPLSLKKKGGRNTNAVRSLRVMVKDEKTGKGIAGAVVNAESQVMQTGKEGIVIFEKTVAVGEKGTVKVSAAGYEPQEKTFISGGEQNANPFSSQDEVSFTLKKSGSGKVTMMVHVIDYATQNPVGKATVSVTDNAGNYIFSDITNAKGDVSSPVSITELDKAPFRVKAKAKGYDENWSDMTADFLQGKNDPVYFTINLKQSKAPGSSKEKKYGPFFVPSSRWVSTGITFKKGDRFRVEASGAFTTKDGSKIGPEGGGYWTWWTLAGQIGKQRMYVSRGGGGTATENDVLELGTPRGLGSKEFIKEDIENLSGKLTVYVFSTKGVWNQRKNFTHQEVDDDLTMLKKIRDKDPNIFLKRGRDEIKSELERILYKYDLTNTRVRVGTNDMNCFSLFEKSEDKKYDNACYNCLNQAVNTLAIKLQGIKK